MSTNSVIESIEIFKESVMKYHGYKINTNHGSINVKMSSSQECCERWYVYASIPDESFQKLIGATILKISYCHRPSEEMYNRYKEEDEDYEEDSESEYNEEENEYNEYKDESETNDHYLNNHCSLNKIRFKMVYLQNNIEKVLYIYLINEHDGYFGHDCVLNWDVVLDGKQNNFAIVECV
jgi:hypothetical protein